VERNGEPIRLPLPAVHSGREQIVLGETVLITQPVNRVRGIVDCLVPGRQYRDQRIPAVVARRLLKEVPGRLAIFVVDAGGIFPISTKRSAGAATQCSSSSHSG
jgi:hypothetical protein